MRSHLRASSRSLLLLSSSAILLGLATGCGVAPGHTGTTAAVAALSGRAMGGQQPIVGATVALYAPSTTGYGNAATLLASTVTGIGGNFTLPAYTCPSTDTITFLQVNGGNPGAGINLAVGEAALLPKCSQLSSSTFVIVSEVTTVAAAYALTPFSLITEGGSTLYTQVGTSATNVTGLNNTLGTANNLANYATGRPHQASELTGITPPTATLTTLANILAACINSNGSTASGTPCGTLFSDTLYAGNNGVINGSADTFQAAIYIAHHPARNVASLFALATANPPYGGGLNQAPNDFSLALTYTGGGIASATTGVSIDAVGNAWIGTGEFNNNGTHALTEIAPDGTYLSGATGFGSAYISAPEAVAIDSNGNVFVACAFGENVVEFDSNGNHLNSVTFPSFQNPNGLSIGANDNIWVSSFNGNQLTKILAGSLLEDPNSPFNTGTEGVEVANSGTATWVANFQSETLSRVEYGTFNLSNVSTSTTPSGLAIDSNNNVYATLDHGVVEYSDSGTLISPAAGFQGLGSLYTQSVIIDGLGNIFASVSEPDSAYGGLLEFNSSGTLLSPDIGFTPASSISPKPAVPNGIAIDGSGNVWITGDSNGSNTLPTVSEVIGIAAPVITPRSVATGAGIGVRP